MNHSFSRGFFPDGGQGDLNAKTQRREAAKSFFRLCDFATLRLCVERAFIRVIWEIRGSLPLVAAGRAVSLCGKNIVGIAKIVDWPQKGAEGA
jgi:hypothetical protein